VEKAVSRRCNPTCHRFEICCRRSRLSSLKKPPCSTAAEPKPKQSDACFEEQAATEAAALAEADAIH